MNTELEHSGLDFRQELEFKELVQKYSYIIRNNISRYRHERSILAEEDYLQEVYIEIYRLFRKNKFVGLLDYERLKAWLYTVSKHTILSVTEKDRYRKWRFYQVEDFTEFHIEDQEYNDLYEKIQSTFSEMPESYCAVLQMYLEGEDMRQRSIQEGRYSCYYNYKMMEVRNFIKRKIGLPIESGMTASKLSLRNKGGGDKAAKRIEQWDITGHLLKIWPSAGEAGRNGFNTGAIIQCCKEKIRSHKGCFWRYHNDQPRPASSEHDAITQGDIDRLTAIYNN